MIKFHSAQLTGVTANEAMLEVTLERYNKISKKTLGRIKKTYPLALEGSSSNYDLEKLCESIRNGVWRKKLDTNQYHCVVQHLKKCDGIDHVVKGVNKNFDLICCDPKWEPNPSTVCTGETFQQKTDCGGRRMAMGTGTCPTPASETCTQARCPAGYSLVVNFSNIPSCFCANASDDVVEIGNKSWCSQVCPAGQRPLPNSCGRVNTASFNSTANSDLHYKANQVELRNNSGVQAIYPTACPNLHSCPQKTGSFYGQYKYKVHPTERKCVYYQHSF